VTNPPSAAQVEARLDSEGLAFGSWSNGPGDRYAPHRHDYDKVLVVAAGEITFGLVELGRHARLGAGDRLDLPAGTSHEAVVGPAGVRCLEAHLPAGTLAPEPRERAGWAGGELREGPGIEGPPPSPPGAAPSGRPAGEER
jgi:quercetin dioxygenase-like cupin family protein